jgi:hypothetical protein
MGHVAGRFVRALGSSSPVIWMVLPRWMYLISLASRAATEEALGTAGCRLLRRQPAFVVVRMSLLTGR